MKLARARKCGSTASTAVADEETSHVTPARYSRRSRWDRLGTSALRRVTQRNGDHAVLTGAGTVHGFLTPAGERGPGPRLAGEESAPLPEASVPCPRPGQEIRALG